MKKPKRHPSLRGPIAHVGRDHIHFWIGQFTKHGIKPDGQAIEKLLLEHPQLDAEEVYSWRANRGIDGLAFFAADGLMFSIKRNLPDIDRDLLRPVALAICQVNFANLIDERNSYGLGEEDPRPSQCKRRCKDESRPHPEQMCSFCGSWDNKCAYPQWTNEGFKL